MLPRPALRPGVITGLILLACWLGGTMTHANAFSDRHAAGTAWLQGPRGDTAASTMQLHKSSTWRQPISARNTYNEASSGVLIASRHLAPLPHTAPNVVLRAVPAESSFTRPPPRRCSC